MRLSALAWVALALAGCQATAVVTTAALSRTAMQAYSPLPPLPADPTNPVADDERAARLGRAVFYDPGYSSTGGVSCATCHQPALAFTDGRARAKALADGTRNTPSLLLAGYQRWQGWGGRGDSLWTQSLAAMRNPKEMNEGPVAAARRVLMTRRADYETLFGPGPDPAGWPADGKPGDRDYDRLPASTRTAVETVAAHLGQCLGAYVRKLVPGPSAFDRYVAGDAGALSPEAVRGFDVFTGKAGCKACHTGPLFSDGDFHDIGVPQPIEAPDRGRGDDLPALLTDVFRAAGPYAASPVALPSPAAADEGRFRTPGLRNVSRTGPYWHAGTFSSLEAAVDFDLAGGGKATGHYFPGVQDEKLAPVALAPDERAALLAFLRALDMGPVPAPWDGPPADAAATSAATP